jgi:hypothetical protein
LAISGSLKQLHDQVYIGFNFSRNKLCAGHGTKLKSLFG